MSVYIDEIETEFLPHNCNWIVSNLMPKFNEENDFFVEPFLPNQKIGIIHLASGIWLNNKDMRIDKSVKVLVKTLKEKSISKSLRYGNQLKKNKISKNWIIKQKRDIYVKQSKIEGYRSRAVYKLQEINEKFKILKNGISVVDLGSAPGSWSQFVARKFKNTKLVSIDLKKIETIENTYQIIGDFTDELQKKKNC